MTASDYIHQFYHLLTRGQIWPTAPADAPVFADLVTSMCQEPARIDADASRIPLIWIDVPDEFLGDFERLLSLDRGALTDPERRAQINGLLALNVGISLSSMQFFVDQWNLAGAVVTDSDFNGFTCTSKCNAPLTGEQWLATFKVTYPGPANPAFEAAIIAASPPNNSVVFVVV